MRRIKSLGELPSMNKQVEVVVPINGEDYVITLRKLSHSEWMRIEREEPMPDAMRRHNSATNEWVVDPGHPETEKRLRDRLARIHSKRIAASVVEDIPGVTLDEKADWMEEAFDTDVLTGLGYHMRDISAEAANAVVLADNFRRDRQAAGVGSGEVESNP